MAGIRKIESAEEAERKGKRNTLILSIVMISILVFSTAGYFTLRDSSESSTGTGSKNVQNVGDAWVLTYGGQSIKISSSPESAENVSISLSKTMDDYYGKTIYISSESESGFYEIYSTLGQYTERVQEACYGKCERNLPEENCSERVIVIKTNLTEKGKIYEEGNCVFIEGGMDAIDAFLYKIFGVI